VETLLASDVTSSQLLADLVREQVGAGLNGAGESASGDRCGPYRLLKPIGQGGMGTVWLAERIDGLLKRPVALKLPHAGSQAWEFAQRAHRERDILASLAHHGIARLYDAGVADGGRPFLVLEFIAGVALDRDCDARKLPIRARLSLFLQVLDAVQYAHSHLVIHSDLKPSNILVTGDGEVKLLDFGIAKLMKAGETSGSDLTQLGSPAMTPGYAAPEQMAGQRVTTACDVYSLGVILFELLSGQRPYTLKRKPDGALEQPVSTGRPSQAATDAAAQARSATPKRLAAALKGDLDNIALKAIQQDPEKRYATVDAFRSDLERYLKGEAVLARPESAWYRTRKFVVRHRLMVAAMAGIFVAIAAGLSVALWEWRLAKREAQTSAAVQQFIQDIFETNTREQTDPLKARQTTARQMLDIGARKIDSGLNNPPAAKEKMLAILADLYSNLDLQDQAVALAKKRAAVAKQAYGANDPRVAGALTSLGETMHSSASVNEEEAVFLEAKRILDSRRDWTSPKRAELCSALAQHYESTDRKRGLEFAQQAVTLYRRLPPSDDLAGALDREATIYSYNDEDAKAEPLLAEAVSVAKQLSGNLDPNLPVYAATLGETNEGLLHYRAAQENLQFAWQTALRLNGENHSDTIETESRLGRFYGNISRYQEGLQHLRHATDVCLRIKGPDDSFFTPQMLFQYGEVLADSGQLETGLSFISRAIQNRRKNRPGTRYLAQMLASQALFWSMTGETESARRSLNESSAISHKVGFTNGNDFFSAQIILAFNSAKPAEALPFIEKHFGSLANAGAPSDNLLNKLYYLYCRSELAILNNDAATAAAFSKRGLKLVEPGGLVEYLKLWEARYLLQEGNAYRMRGDPASALPPLERSLQLETGMFDAGSPDIAVAEAALGSCYLDLGKHAEATKLLTQAESIIRMHKRLAEQYTRPVRALREHLAVDIHQHPP
jgi:hypothetical protein